MKHPNAFAGILLIVLSVLIVVSILAARKGRELFIRRIAGVDAINEAVGRATEMGRPIFFSVGLGGIDIVTLQAFSIIGHVARMAAEFRTRLIVPVADPLAIPVLEEIVREACNEVGRPEAFNPDDIRFLSTEQFAYAAGCVGIMHREQPATNFLFGTFMAESLILAETGQHIGALQVGGTPSQLQTPFFIATCDYVIIGEEYYATTAYLTREPVLLGSLVGQDRGKMLLLGLMLLGILLVSLIKPLVPIPTPNLLPPPVSATLPTVEVPFQLTAAQMKSIDDLHLRTVASETVKKAQAQLQDSDLPTEEKQRWEEQVASAQEEFDKGLERILTPEQNALREKVKSTFPEVRATVEKEFADRLRLAQERVDSASQRVLGASLDSLEQRLQAGDGSPSAEAEIDKASKELKKAQEAQTYLAEDMEDVVKERFKQAFDNLLLPEEKRAMSAGQRRYWVQTMIETIGG